MMRGTKWTFALVLGAAAAAPAVLAAQDATTGSVTGRVTDAATGRPIPSAQVQVVGTSLGALTNEQGQYTIRAVPARSVTVRALRVGYAERSGTVAVTANQAATLNLAMSASAVSLTPVVTTATGEQRRVEVPSAIATVQAAELTQERQISNVGDLLTARAAGVQVLSGNQIGAGSRIRIRGQTTLNLSNDPIVFVDGVRIDARSDRQNLGAGGTAQGSLNDLNPDEIESMEVVRGPSASVLYGTEAANGVIVITTKRGRPGATRLSLYTQQGLTQDKSDYPDAVYVYGRNATTGANIAAGCANFQVASGACRADSVSRYNVFENDRGSPLKNGWLREYGANLTGGNANVRYALFGELMNQTGTLGLTPYDRDRALRAGGPGLRAEWEEPNALTQRSGRANLDLTLGKATVAINSNYIDRRGRFPQNDNNVTGIYGNALLGTGRGTLLSASGDSLYGFNQFNSLEIAQALNQTYVQRFLGSVQPRYTPTSWLTLRSNAGIDFTSQFDESGCLFGQCTAFGTNRQGFRNNTRGRNFVYTLDGSGSANFRPLEWLGSTTTIGAQWVSNRLDQTTAGGQILPPGGQTISQASIPASGEATTVSRTQGAFAQQEFAVRDRLFINARVRVDNNSAFGRNFKTQAYPGVGASYVISEEGFFPFKDKVDQLRIRANYGTSGNRPGTTAALPNFAANTAVINQASVPGLIFQTSGNVELKPATVSEFEYGLDFTGFGNRVSLELTRYDKSTKDDLIDRILPPSYGAGANTRFENIGRIRNWGTEYLLNVQPIQRANFGWDFLINGSRNSNEVEDLGPTPPIIGATTRTIEGYPIAGYWARPYTYNDANNDGLLAVSEVSVAPADSAKFVGYNAPRTEIVFQNGFDFFNKRIRLVGQIDYKGDYKVLNLTDRFRCTDFANAFDRNDPSAPLDRQARCVAAQAGANQTFFGYMEDGSFVRLRELSIAARVPESFVRRIPRLGFQNASVTFAARNLALWTDFTGIDPEASYGQGNVQQNFLTQPPLRTYALRVNLGF
ncbi:SusC/RagA family TonB-linked outer membrane protein [Roseisolibacter sp. H3M3-2]|uniref:SusC/RagA family TonB-linked outer membrane protein n=1 Tax=Roseisolibacter sp. H3M3-2 TaxID=3031323 RepID=UPI0023DC4CF5|nr:SusC/RagA family TonB-linked outer membrane protein [Roseisolibacter sp. H3M3-2]MDF1501973.1 SusC/RagA family TonB-linked outer membrane protein [Roseisolibacter sp. H3M3-2]